VRFPIYKPLPYDLIREMVTFMLKENHAKAVAKQWK
jgi:uncharacterized protein YdhG (YjbR/CyaY superfamily)